MGLSDHNHQGAGGGLQPLGRRGTKFYFQQPGA